MHHLNRGTKKWKLHCFLLLDQQNLTFWRKSVKLQTGLLLFFQTSYTCGSYCHVQPATSPLGTRRKQKIHLPLTAARRQGRRVRRLQERATRTDREMHSQRSLCPPATRTTRPSWGFWGIRKRWGLQFGGVTLHQHSLYPPPPLLHPSTLPFSITSNTQTIMRFLGDKKKVRSAALWCWFTSAYYCPQPPTPTPTPYPHPPSPLPAPTIFHCCRQPDHHEVSRISCKFEIRVWTWPWACCFLGGNISTSLTALYTKLMSSVCCVWFHRSATCSAAPGYRVWTRRRACCCLGGNISTSSMASLCSGPRRSRTLTACPTSEFIFDLFCCFLRGRLSDCAGKWLCADMHLTILLKFETEWSQPGVLVCNHILLSFVDLCFTEGLNLYVRAVSSDDNKFKELHWMDRGSGLPACMPLLWICCNGHSMMS